MNIKVRKIREDACVPIRASDGAVGYDVFASRVLDKFSKEVAQDLPVAIEPGGSVLIGIGVQMALPWPFQCEVRPRSGLASKHDIELSNSPGTIDPDFRGEAGVLLRNRGSKTFIVEKGMRVAQLIFSEVAVPILEETDELLITRRGAGGFGSTGLTGIGLGTQDFDEAIRMMDEYYMKVTLAISDRSVCVRGVKKIDGHYERDGKGKLVGQTRKFGAIFVKDDNIIAQGFNDQYLGSRKCAETGCLREELKIPSGTQIEKCRAMHAEWWAITNAGRSGSGVSLKNSTLYVNTEPCEVCAKIITGLQLETVVMLEGVYPTNGIAILREAGINVRYVKIDGGGK
ncbi:MAG: dUTP diphosphatase [bacterium]|nr:dUTP diphosphatase [bacterium]